MKREAEQIIGHPKGAKRVGKPKAKRPYKRATWRLLRDLADEEVVHHMKD